MNCKHKSCSNAMMESKMNEAFPLFQNFSNVSLDFSDHQQRSYFMYFRQPPNHIVGKGGRQI